MKKDKLVKTSRKVILGKSLNPDNLFTLTQKFQNSKKCSDGKRRSFFLFFLNNVLILKQKVPFNEKAEHGCQFFIGMKNVYLLGGNLHQTREVGWHGKERIVKFPVSKTILQALNVPSDLKILSKE